MATLISFTAGLPILSAEVNANFTALNVELVTRRAFVATTASSTVGGGEDGLGTWMVPANAMIANSGIHVRGLAFFATNANFKILRFYVGGTPIILNPTTVAPNSRYAVIDLWVMYQTAASAIVSGTVIFNDNTIELVVAVQVGTSIDWASATQLAFTGQGTADGDVQLVNVAMAALRNTS